MKSVSLFCVILVIVLVLCTISQATVVSYNLTNISSNQYEYTYTIGNDTLTVPIQEFTIWFDVDLYDNLAITTPASLSSQWNEVILKDTGFGLPIGYDALAQTEGILPNGIVTGFSVKFDWLGTNLPGSQFFEIIDPVTFETIDSGFTVPEPSVLLMFSLSGLIFRMKSKRTL